MLELRQWTQILCSKSKLVQQHKLLNLTEYLFKETVVQPSTEEYFGRVQLYTGLPDFDVLNITFFFL